MDGESSRRDNQEITLQENVAGPRIRLQYLNDITNNFSAQQILGAGGFGVVYKVRVKHIFFFFSICFLPENCIHINKRLETGRATKWRTDGCEEA
jgi:hypothetical protein